MRAFIDISGQTFGFLTTIRPAAKRGRRAFWLCQCTCGNKTEIVRDNLISGHTTSCGCRWRMKTGPRQDLTGQRFGMLVVLKYAGRGSREGESYWECRCDCGGTKKIAGYNLRNISRSCGCQIRVGLAKANTKHGLTGTTEYRLWVGMLTRCYNKNEEAYKHYGGRGIYVVRRWRGEGGFENFLADMGKRPETHLQIERNNNNGPYSPKNCRWATRVEQGRNRRNTIRIRHGGIMMSLMEVCRLRDLNYGTIRSRMFKQGMSFEQAATTPLLRKYGGIECRVGRHESAKRSSPRSMNFFPPSE